MSSSELDNLDLTKDPPPIEIPNVYPVEWTLRSPKLADLYERAKKEAWNPSTLPWEELKANDYDDRQRTAMAYWWALLANFENSGPPVFAKAMINTFEIHEEDAVKKMFASIVMDECRHDECCMRACNRLCPGFLSGWKPKTELDEKALRNIKWVYYNGARYWKGYQKAYFKHTWPIIFTSFMMGEKCASTLFGEMSRKSQHPVYQGALKNIARDESRHLAFTWLGVEGVGSRLTEQEKKAVTKQIRAGFVFLSMILYEPPNEFWKLPPDFLDTHRRLEEIARSAGLGILSLEEKTVAWKNAILDVKRKLESFGVEFPALPEIGISGNEIEFDEQSMMPTF
jgi:hypothetical protein